MENKKEIQSEVIDPVGIDLAFSSFSILISIVSLLHQIGFIPRKKKKIIENMRTIKREVMRLQNAIDDLILTLHRFNNNNPDIDLSKNSLTIAETSLMLKEKDYVRWIDIQDTIKKVDKKIYQLISEIRILMIDYVSESNNEYQYDEVVKSIDNTLLNMSKMTFVEFIERMRSNLNSLIKTIDDLVGKIK